MSLAHETLRFPEGFLWGAATAAHQVEGRLDNDWAHFERRPKTIKNGDRSDVGVDHYHRFDSDFALAQDMGHNAHRLSVEWSRIEPERGSLDMAEVAHYHDVLASLRKRGLEPLVTLHHFTSPRWIADQGGWLSARRVEDFVRFATFMGREFRSEVRYWITINEPNIYAWHSYVTGIWPPGKRSFGAALRSMSHMGRAHVLAYHALHEIYREDSRLAAPLVGISQNLMTFACHSSWSPLDRAVAKAGDRIFNRSFLEAVTTGRARFTVPLLGGIRTSYAGASGGALDFLGVNYYTRVHCRFPGVVMAAPGSPTNDLGWEIYPDGLYQAIRLANEFATLAGGRKIPILITENGIDDRSGERRGAYLVQHLQAVHRAISEGVDVRGYVHWTLMDNFEWAEGYAPRFGLYYIDRQNDLARVETPAVPIYRAVARSNALGSDLLERFGTA